MFIVCVCMFKERIICSIYIGSAYEMCFLLKYIENLY